MRALEIVRGWVRGSDERSVLPLDDWASRLNVGGLEYPLMGGSLGGSREEIDHSYLSYVEAAYRRNGPVFACEALRTRVFSEARFAWQRRDQGRRGQLFTTADLEPLERPWPGGTTQDLLQRMLLSADLGGSAYVCFNGLGHLRILRPDWVTVIRGSDVRSPEDDPDGLDARLLGYVYMPGGNPAAGEFIEPHEMAHFVPDPDPSQMFRGTSWITAVLREIQGDQLMSTHKLQYFERGATPNLVVSVDAAVTPEQFEEFRRRMDDKHAGVMNAYRTMYLGGGASAQVVGNDLQQLDFKTVQGHGETRIAMAAGVHPVVVGMSEGMQGSSLNAGNYSQARRNVADTTFHPLWRACAGALGNIIRPSGNAGGAELVADTRDVPFLRQDERVEAEVLQTRAATLSSLISQGFTPESAKALVDTGDFSQLDHTGLVSVQLQPPGVKADPDGEVDDVDEEDRP